MKEELKIKDVMVEDWVDVRKNAAPNTTHLERITPSHFLRDEHWYGVELVPEILEKNGFVKGYMFNNVWNYIKDYKRLVIVYTGEAFNIQGTLIEFKHVHELQHILKICGIEKEIIL